MLKKIKNFICSERGSISIVAVILLPILLWCLFFFESKMQVRWIYTQVQSVMDFSTLAGANQGTSEKVAGAKYACTIPYDVSNQDKSGYHVTVKLFKENLSTLPKNIADELRQQVDSDEIIGLKDRDSQMAGYMYMQTSFKYPAKVKLFFNDHVIRVKSTSRCQPDTN